jgi:hypothetical protein
LAATNGLRCPIGNSLAKAGLIISRGCSADKCYFQIFESFEQDTTKGLKPPFCSLKRRFDLFGDALCHIAHLLFVFTFDHDPDQGSVPDLAAPGHGQLLLHWPLPAERHWRSADPAFGEAHIDQHLRELAHARTQFGQRHLGTAHGRQHLQGGDDTIPVVV